jgi:hypothetical protein
MGIPYTHSGVLPRRSRWTSRRRGLFAGAGITRGRGPRRRARRGAAGDPMPRPYVVKPLDEGSSVGVTIVRQRRQSAAFPQRGWHSASKVLVERYIPGRELTVGVMGDRALAVTEIRPHPVLRLRSQIHRRHHRAPGAGAGAGEGLRRDQAPGVSPHQRWAAAASRAPTSAGTTRSQARARSRDPRGQHPARHDAAVAGARAGAQCRHLLRRSW